MRVYEFAKAKGITSAAVIRMAEASDVEVYSALSQLEDDDVETLSRSLLKGDAAGLKAEAAAVANRRRAKAAKAAAAQAEKDKAQAEALEAARQRAIAVHNGLPAPAPKSEPPPAPKKKEPALEIGATLPEMPKVSIQVSEPEEREETVEEEDDDEVDARDYLHGKDLRTRPSAKPKKEKDKEKDKENRSPLPPRRSLRGRRRPRSPSRVLPRAWAAPAPDSRPSRCAPRARWPLPRLPRFQRARPSRRLRRSRPSRFPSRRARSPSAAPWW